MIHIRRAGSLDATSMTKLLNEIIAKGGTTAFVTSIDSRTLRAWLAQPDTIWHLAENETGALLGFQWIAPHKDLPEDSVDIASFVAPSAAGLGIGSALFDHTQKAARQKNYRFIHAIIRADNQSGLTYYQSRGFEDYARLSNQRLEDGTKVDKIWKRFALAR